MPTSGTKNAPNDLVSQPPLATTINFRRRRDQRVPPSITDYHCHHRQFTTAVNMAVDQIAHALIAATASV
jgi:hypothetical protein